MTGHRKLRYLAPCLVAAAPLLLAAPGCSGGDESPPVHAAGAPTTTRGQAADKALKHDVAWVAAAAARCSQPDAAPDCAAAATSDIARVAPRSLRPRGLVSDVLAQLPIKPIICALAQKYLGGSSSGDTRDAGAPDTSSPDAADAATSPSPARPAFDVWGARAVVENGGVAEEKADLHEVWDMERCQAAMFVHPSGSSVAAPNGITGITGNSGYRGPARGASSGVIEGGGGTFVLDGALTEPAHLRKVGAMFFADVAAAAGPEDLPLVEGAFIAAHRGGAAYVPWDTGTRALLALRTGKSPRIAGTEGARFVQYEADAESGTTCGAQMAVAMLTQTSDGGDFDSSAGAGALTAIATGVARSLGLDLEAWCGDAEPGSDGGSTSTSDGSVAASTSCHAKDPGFCGDLSCTPNGDGIVCCRPEPTGDEACPTGSDAECGPGFVCSIKRKPVAEGEPTQVCARREVCR